MKTKLDAVRLALAARIPVHILDGRKPRQMASALVGEDVGTHFPLPRTTSLKGMKSEPPLGRA